MVSAVLAVMAFGSMAFQAPVSPAPRTSNPPAAGRVVAARSTGHVQVDGRDADAVWRTAAKVSGFRQFDPREGADARFPTEFQAAYDGYNLYVFIRAYDPHPDSIMRALTRRDNRGPSDQLKIIIDSYDDNRSGFEFAINPDGVKRDYAIYNDSNEDDSWNGVWDAAAQVDSLGWTAEFRIPLSQLRYADAEEHTFGFGVWRDLERYKERDSWPAYRPTQSGLVSQLGSLEGITGIRSSRHVEVTPYTVVKSETRGLAGGEFERAEKLTVGADLKYGLTPNLTLDATVNPDFGQVEADPAVLNLTAFETFLAERRPFFLEGTGQYRFALNCYIVVDCSTNEGLFYSRRIGRMPYLHDLYGDAGTATATPIAAAFKLTGRTRRGLALGVLDALTPDVDGTQNRTVEPHSNYAVLSVQQDLRGGEAGVSVIGTAVNRALDEWTEDVLHRGAYAAGLSFRNRFAGRRYELAGSVAASHVTGTAAAIARTQRSAVHYYQQPDDDVAFDATRTSLSGHAEQLKFGKYGGGITRFETSLVRQSAGFEVNDLGYLRRADRLDWSTWASLNWFQPTAVYRWLRLNGNHWRTWNTSGRGIETAVNLNAHIGLNNNWNLHGGGTLANLGEVYCDRCTRGGPALRRARALYPWFGVNGDSRKVLVPSVWANLGWSDEGESEYVSLSPSLAIRVSTRLQAQLGVNISNDHNDSQWFGNSTDETTGETHYTFAHLRQRTLSMNVRASYTALPNLTFEFYGEPFVSRGTYSGFRELSASPAAEQYRDRFIPWTPGPDAATSFRFSQLRTNAVARWEYLPGSTLFVVWSHGRSGSDGAEREGWRRDYDDLFELHPDNTFLVKLAYWLGR